MALLRQLRNGALGVKEVKVTTAPAQADAVQVMTIHAAKGLEFEQVYLADLARGQARQRASDFLKNVNDAPALMLMGHGNLLAHQAQALDEKIAAAETVRLLYVAATRARRRLVIFASLPTGAGETVPEIVTLVDLLKPSLAGWPAAGEGPPGVAVRHVAVLQEPEQPAHLPATSGAETSTGPDAGVLLAAENALVQKRALAAQHQSRPWHTTPSAQAHHRWRDDADAQDGTGALTSLSRPDAMAVGVLVHGVLENLDLHTAPGAARAALPALLQQAARRLDTPPGEAALKEAGELLQTLLQGPLGQRLFELGPRVVARELPLLLSPQAAALPGSPPVGAVYGALDLLYQDEDGGLVVVDFKTDHVADEAGLQEKTRAYAPQGQLYVQAVALALGLKSPPRFELWFLRAGRVVEAGG